MNSAELKKLRIFVGQSSMYSVLQKLIISTIFFFELRAKALYRQKKHKKLKKHTYVFYR